MRIHIPVPRLVSGAFCCLVLLACAFPCLSSEEPPAAADRDAELKSAIEVMFAADRAADEGDFTRAAELAGQALEIRRRLLGDDDPLTLEALSDRGHYLAESEDIEAAEPVLREALAGRRKALGNEHEATLASLADLASLLQGQRRYDEAEAPIREAVETARRVMGPESETTLDLLDQQAELLLELGRYAEVEPILLQILEACKKGYGEEQGLISLAYYNLGSLYYRWGKLDESLANFDQALALDLENKGEDDPGTLTAILNRANVLVSLGRLDEAEQDYRRALKGRQRIHGVDHPRTLTAVNNLGFCHNNQGRYPEAEDCFRRSLAGYRQLFSDEHPDTLLAMLNLGHVLKKQWRLPEADSLLRRALTGFRAVYGNDHPLTITALHNLASLLEAQGRLEEAEAAYGEVHEGRLRLLGPDSPRTITLLNNLGLLAKKQGDYETSETLFRQALTERRRVLGDENHHTLTTIGNLGVLLLDLGRLEEAEPLVREALAGRQKVLGPMSPRTLFSLLQLGLLLEQKGDLDEAERLIREAVDGLREVFGAAHADFTSALSLLADHYYRRGDLARATATWTEAASSFEAARLRSGAGGLERVHFAAGNSPLSPLAACLARAGKPLAAWERFEAGLARGLLDTVSARQARPLTRDERRREADLLSRLSRFDERLGRLYGKAGFDNDEERQATAKGYEREREALLEELAVFHADLSGRYGAAAGDVYGLARIQSQIPEDTALVGWVDIDAAGASGKLGGEHWACMVRRSGPPVWVALPGSGPDGAWTEDDTALPGYLRESLGRRVRRPSGHRRQEMLRQQLRAQRIDPLAPHLVGVSHLVVMPAGWMAGIPVEALVDERTISYAPSGTIFAWLRENAGSAVGCGATAAPTLLALGDPVFGREKAGAATGSATRAAPPPGPERQARFASLEPLPGTRAEVMAIARLFPAPDDRPGPTVLLGAEASERRLAALSDSGRLGDFCYIHLATHGVMDDKVAMRSALVLSQDQLGDAFDRVVEGKAVYDGWLTGEQIVRSWKLDADLVTLSGCETALGQEAGGEGYLGFSQALFVAGARSLVLSLWKVDDRATMLLMKRFYENLLGRFPEARALSRIEYEPGSPMPRAEALHEAKNWLRQFSPDGRSDHPYQAPRYWAAFILLGDPL